MKQLARVLALKVLKATGFDTVIRHHWAPERKFHLHTFRHKGYWWHGRRREQDTMESVARIIHKGDTVIEIGAHIGYLSVHFRELVGDDGKVIVFEPGQDNRLYLKKNVACYDNVTVEAAAVSDFNGQSTFYVEDLSGQNNSLLPAIEMLEVNNSSAGMNVKARPQNVTVTTLDSYCDAHNLKPSFIKIDVEGAERECLKGAKTTLQKHRPILLLEVTHHHADVDQILKEVDYVVYDEKLHTSRIDTNAWTNYYCFPRERAVS